MTATVPRPNLGKSAGILYYAPLGTAEPTNTPTASVFVDADWGVTWVPLGATDKGTTLHYETKMDRQDAAEFLDPIEWNTTDRSGFISFELLDITAKNLARALNGGITTVTGATTTQATKVEPVSPGNEVRVMIGWQSLDGTIRFVGRRCVNAAALDIKWDKPPSRALINCQFNFEMPSDGTAPWAAWFAGTARG